MTPSSPDPLTAEDAPLADAMYECCIRPPQTDHADHVLANLRRNGWDVTRAALLEATPSPEPALDVAWREAEVALPEEWSFWQVTEYYPQPGQPFVVTARVRLADTIDDRGQVPEVSASGPTPAAALHALAARLAFETPEPEQ